MTDDLIDKATYLRLAADFDNYRKDEVRRTEDLLKFGLEKLLLEIADVLDAIERSKAEQYDMRTLLEQILHKHGAIRIETRDKPFDPVLMESVGAEAGGESQTVKEEVRAGYTMHGRVIRPARVIIYH